MQQRRRGPPPDAVSFNAAIGACRGEAYICIIYVFTFTIAITITITLTITITIASTRPSGRAGARPT